MTDREMLELAAKAAALSVEWDGDGFVRPVPFKGFTNYEAWNPLIDDGDALRLVVKLKLFLDVTPEATGVQAIGVAFCSELHGDDQYESTRRAIVRAAAEIGKAMQ